MLQFLDAISERAEHLRHEFGVRTTGKRSGLRLLHLRRGDQLHRLGDLAGVFDRLDAAADVAGGGHRVIFDF